MEDAAKEVSIPFRRIVCKRCNRQGTSNEGFAIYESPIPGRVRAHCEDCGTDSLIKRALTFVPAEES